MNKQTPDFALLDLQPTVAHFRTDVLEGLAQQPKTLHCKLLYDDRGSALFEEITRLPEYYPTRAEVSILTQYADEISGHLGVDVVLVELGSGNSEKVQRLLHTLDSPTAYVPIDIERSYLEQAAQSLASNYPDLQVAAICADYTRDLKFPDIPGKKVVFFPGSTFGNFEPVDANAFLDRLAASLRPGDGVLIGIDLKKNPDVLNRAYNDAAGVTAAFNLNILRRINRELDGDFDLDTFEHFAFYNRDAGRIEMHLRSLANQVVHVSGTPFAFKTGDTIHTENSYKYDIGGFQALAAAHGFVPAKVWTDENDLFSVHYLAVGE